MWDVGILYIIVIIVRTERKSPIIVCVRVVYRVRWEKRAGKNGRPSMKEREII